MDSSNYSRNRCASACAFAQSPGGSRSTGLAAARFTLDTDIAAASRSSPIIRRLSKYRPFGRRTTWKRQFQVSPLPVKPQVALWRGAILQAFQPASGTGQNSAGCLDVVRARSPNSSLISAANNLLMDRRSWLGECKSARSLCSPPVRVCAPSGR